MKKVVCRHRVAILFGVFAWLAVSVVFTAAYRDDQKKPKREKFGSSLKRLRWDAAKHAAVEKPARPDKYNPKENDSDAAIKLETLLVTFEVLVTDENHTHAIRGLTKDDFMVTEEGKPQPVAAFALGSDANLPRSIILLIDWSRSQEAFVQTSVLAAKGLIDKLGPADEMAIITDDVDIVCDYTKDKLKLGAALDLIEKRAFDPVRRSGSWQFSALFAALRELVNEGQRRPIIIFQTDGDEAASFRDQPHADRYAALQAHRAVDDFGLEDIYAAAKKSRATIYSVITNDRLAGLPDSQLYRRGAEILLTRWHEALDPDNPHDLVRIKLWTDLFLEGQKAAAQVAFLSGGWVAFLKSPAQAQQIYDLILSDINQRYVVGYYPTNTARDGSIRNVKIAIKDHPEYYVHGRTSYYAPGRP